MKNPFFIHGYRAISDFCLNLVIFGRMWDWRVVNGRFYNLLGEKQGGKLA